MSSSFFPLGMHRCKSHPDHWSKAKSHNARSTARGWTMLHKLGRVWRPLILLLPPCLFAVFEADGVYLTRIVLRLSGGTLVFVFRGVCPRQGVWNPANVNPHARSLVATRKLQVLAPRATDNVPQGMDVLMSEQSLPTVHCLFLFQYASTLYRVSKIQDFMMIILFSISEILRSGTGL